MKQSVDPDQTPRFADLGPYSLSYVSFLGRWALKG